MQTKVALPAGSKRLGQEGPVFIVAEVSGNHNQSIANALKIIDVAADTGADAVKLQTYTQDTMTINSDRPEFIIKSKNKSWRGKTLYELYGEAYTPWEWHKKLFAHARKRGLVCFSTPFDKTAVAFLETLGNPVYKVASFEVVDIPLLEAIGKTRKPVIMSRGMATLAELSLAIKTLKKFGTKDITLLQCISAYPARSKDMHLANIPDLAKRFRVAAGLSDHTLNDDVAVAAVALGARVIEKHLTLRRSDGGPDASFSMEPKEFASLVKSIRATSEAVGKPSYSLSADEKENTHFRKSLFAVADIKKGERFTAKNVRSIRPGNGMAPKHYRMVCTKRASRDLKRGEPLAMKHLR
ncbi:MAG: Pseudaminic acid synthase [Parcubacteria group bacterium GW2011_GWB1_57_6]|nr:MAG: Pseudaminic acid synthase [Parcubacteria group bacterium GW2011_GWB1_57_6]